MKAFWRISLSCLVWTCTGIVTAANATPYTFNESSNANSASNRAPVYPIYTDSSNSGLPDALTGNEGPIEFKHSRNAELERTASNQPFMKEVVPGGREFSPNGGSIKSTTDYRFSNASQSIPVEEWYGNHMRGQGQWQGQWQGRRRRNRNRNFQGGNSQSARGLNSNFDFVNNANPNLNKNNYSNNIGASGFGSNRFNNSGFGTNNFNNNNNNNNNNFSSNNFSNNNFNNSGNNGFNRNNKRNRNRNNPDPTVDIKQPDRVADNPQVDGDGVRHFSNGKHLDLSKMSLDDAIGATNASGEDSVNNNRNSRNTYNASNGLSSGNSISSAPPLTLDNSFVSSAATRRHLPYQVK